MVTLKLRKPILKFNSKYPSGLLFTRGFAEASKEMINNAVIEASQVADKSYRKYSVGIMSNAEIKSNLLIATLQVYEDMIDSVRSIGEFGKIDLTCVADIGEELKGLSKENIVVTEKNATLSHVLIY